MKRWYHRNRLRIPPPAHNNLLVGDLVLRTPDSLLCIVVQKESSTKAVWGMPGEYRIRYRLVSKKGIIWAMDTEIVASYQVLNYVKR